MAIPVAANVTPEEYLAAERKAKFRSEYWLGVVYAMSGAVARHEIICSNLSFATQLALRGRDCQVFGSSMKVGTTKKRGFAYPDLTIVCGKQLFYDDVQDVLMNPMVIFEVLSESTRKFDMRDKLREYSRMGSLRHYVMVEQNIRSVTHYARQEERWMYEDLGGEDDVLQLTAIGLELPLREIYYRVEVASEDQDLLGEGPL